MRGVGRDGVPRSALQASASPFSHFERLTPGIGNSLFGANVCGPRVFERLVNQSRHVDVPVYTMVAVHSGSCAIETRFHMFLVFLGPITGLGGDFAQSL
jgi:hypothetical protein